MISLSYLMGLFYAIIQTYKIIYIYIYEVGDGQKMEHKAWHNIRRKGIGKHMLKSHVFHKTPFYPFGTTQI